MEKVEVNAYAKVNLSLNVLGKKDNMHTLDMVLTSIGIYDVIRIEKRDDDEIKFKCKILKEDNNGTKALKLFKEKFNTKGFNLTISSHIPFSAGLGGSSADASGVLKALCVMYGISETDERIKEIALAVGSDVYAMLIGGFVRVKGTGDEVTKISTNVRYKVLVLKGRKGVSTKECFEKFDSSSGEPFADNDKIEELLKKGDRNIYPYMYNMLEKSAISLNNEIEYVMESVKEYKPLKVMLTGSGSGVIALFDENIDVIEIEEKLREKIKYVKAVGTVLSGVKVVK